MPESIQESIFSQSISLARRLPWRMSRNLPRPLACEAAPADWHPRIYRLDGLIGGANYTGIEAFYRESAMGRKAEPSSGGSPLGRPARGYSSWFDFVAARLHAGDIVLVGRSFAEARKDGDDRGHPLFLGLGLAGQLRFLKRIAGLFGLGGALVDQNEVFGRRLGVAASGRQRPEQARHEHRWSDPRHGRNPTPFTASIAIRGRRGEPVARARGRASRS